MLILAILHPCFVLLCTATDYKPRLLRHAKFLVRNMECQFVLLDDLCQRHVINDKQCTDIKYDPDSQLERSDDNKNMQLIKVMQRVSRLSKFEKFLTALADTDQRHIAAYIVCNGGKNLVNLLEMLVLIWHFQLLNPHSVHTFSYSFC